MQGYELNQSAAKKADMGGRIEQTGKYLATIVRAELKTAGTGTEGVEFEVKTDAGATGSFSLWTRKPDGTTLRGYDLLMSMMTCCGVKSITAKQGMVKKYDHNSKEMVDQQAWIAPEMMGVRIGLLLEREVYQNSNGEDRHRLNLFAAFQHNTELVASEILDRVTAPKILPTLVARLNARGEQQPAYHKPATSAHSPKPASKPTGSYPSNGLDDDLPF